MYTCVWRPKFEVRCLPQLLFTSYIEVSLNLDFAFSLLCAATTGRLYVCLAFIWVLGIFTLVPTLTTQVLSPRHLPSLKVWHFCLHFLNVRIAGMCNYIWFTLCQWLNPGLYDAGQIDTLPMEPAPQHPRKLPMVANCLQSQHSHYQLSCIRSLAS